jgi:hypothetical protein
MKKKLVLLKKRSLSWLNKSLTPKQIFMTSLLSAAFLVIIFISCSLYKFNQTGYPAGSFFQTAYWNLLGLYYDRVASTENSSGEQVIIPTEIPTPTRPPALPATYVSDKLGISFNYIPFIPNGIGQYFFTKEIGDTIYLYWVPGVNQPYSGTDTEFLKTIVPDSKYVEVFSKDPDDTLTQAVTKRFLQGYSPEHCPIFPEKLPTGTLIPARQAVKISIPRIHYKSYADAYAAENLCPPIYTDWGHGVAYFMMEPDHADKFVFFKIGQDNLPSGVWGMGTWDSSIFFVPPAPTPAPGQKAIYTFYIRATSHESSPRKAIALTQADTGNVFSVDAGTLILLRFAPGKFTVSTSSPQDMFKCVGSECLPHSSPGNTIAAFWVHAGSGTIQVVEAE